MSTPRRFKFTHRLIDSLLPNEPDVPSREAEYSDPETSGFRCLVGKGEGKKKFLLRYLWQGRKRAVNVGHWPKIDVMTARKITTEMKRQITAGIDPRYERDKCWAIPTLQGVFSQYYFPWTKLHKKSWDKDEQRLRDHITPVVGNLLLGEITSRHVTHLQSSLYETCQPTANNRVIALLKVLLKWSLHYEMVATNPAANTPLLCENNARQRHFSETEIRRIFEAASEDNSRVASIYIRLLLLTGLRRDEPRLAKWAYYSLQQGTLRLPEAKNGTGRLVHLNDWAIKLIAELPRFGGNIWMFGGKIPDKPICNVAEVFRRVIRRAGVYDDEVHIRTYRHSVVALIVSQGGTLYDVQAQLGHHSIQPSQRYAYLHPQKLKATGQLVEQHISNALVFPEASD